MTVMLQICVCCTDIRHIISHLRLQQCDSYGSAVGKSALRVVLNSSAKHLAAAVVFGTLMETYVQHHLLQNDRQMQDLNMRSSLHLLGWFNRCTRDEELTQQCKVASQARRHAVVVCLTEADAHNSATHA